MIRKELWMCWLAYNLIRQVITQPAANDMPVNLSSRWKKGFSRYATR
jgi:hypothetical protein